jgi:hypothetical protein
MALKKITATLLRTEAVQQSANVTFEVDERASYETIKALAEDIGKSPQIRLDWKTTGVYQTYDFEVINIRDEDQALIPPMPR